MVRRRAWHEVARLLRASGFAVAIPELPGSSLADDTAAVRAAIDALDGNPPVVCGHSYGGAVITGLAPDSVAHLVYLAAVMPDENETVLGLAESEPTQLLDAARPAGRPGYTVLDPAMAATMLFGQSPPEKAAIYAAGLVPQNMAPGSQTPQRVAWRSVPYTYVVCERDQTFSPALQRRLAERAGSSETWDSDHTPFLRVPGEVARLLASRAAAWTTWWCGPFRQHLWPQATRSWDVSSSSSPVGATLPLTAGGSTVVAPSS